MPGEMTKGQCCCAEAHLSQRQLEVVLGVAQGLTDREIARDLSVSPHTVRDYLTVAMQATGARSRAQLVALAYTSGLVGAGWPPEPTDQRCLRMA